MTKTEAKMPTQVHWQYFEEAGREGEHMDDAACWQCAAERLGRYNNRLREINAELVEALLKLSNEALGMVELARPAIGNTNASVLIKRVTEARAALAKARSGKGE